MKIQLLSDLHNEFSGSQRAAPIEATGADLIVLAGDIDLGLQGIEWAGRESKRLGKPLLYVAGNHEFYRHDISLAASMAAEAKKAGVLFLENEGAVLEGVRFLGCTLWSDYRAAGDAALAMQTAAESLNDHRLIRNGEHPFMPQDALALHNRSREWLAAALAEPFAGKTVVVTHHGPHMLCQHPSHSITPLSAAFWSDLGDLVEQADVWCFGHSHGNIQTRWGKCRLLCNQRGYDMENRWDFRPDFVFEV